MEVGGQFHATAALPPERENPLYTLSTSSDGPLWQLWWRETFISSVGNQTRPVQAVVRHYTDWATLAPYQECIYINFYPIVIRSANEKITCWRPRYTWKGYIKMDFSASQYDYVA
jgi:hypothetical protein